MLVPLIGLEGQIGFVDVRDKGGQRPFVAGDLDLSRLIAAGLAVYMAIAFVGRAPSPELLLSQVTRWWGRTMRKLTIGPPAPNLGGGWALARSGLPVWRPALPARPRAKSCTCLAKRSPQGWGARGAAIFCFESHLKHRSSLFLATGGHR